MSLSHNALVGKQPTRLPRPRMPGGTYARVAPYRVCPAHRDTTCFDRTIHERTSCKNFTPMWMSHGEKSAITSSSGSPVLPSSGYNASAAPTVVSLGLRSRARGSRAVRHWSRRAAEHTRGANEPSCEARDGAIEWGGGTMSWRGHRSRGRGRRPDDDSREQFLNEIRD